ncbi:MAG: glycerol-3-phosphate responsive antiterminator [Lachnospiraceae bacterium]|nr:glycerol-3-phosphate responsive antiterminator [Lachnospiraceae bacterium]
MKKEYRKIIEHSPVIAAVNDFESMAKALTCDSPIIFILFGDICNIAEIVEKVKNAQKLAVVHIDQITGLASKEAAVDFIQQQVGADGIISSKPALIKYASKLSLFTVLRFFVTDSHGLAHIERQLQIMKPDMIEILPVLMPKILSQVCNMVRIPVVTGGLICDKEDVTSILASGVSCVSSTSEDIWFL